MAPGRQRQPTSTNLMWTQCLFAALSACFFEIIGRIGSRLDGELFDVLAELRF
jgi:hypothetical protein